MIEHLDQGRVMFNKTVMAFIAASGEICLLERKEIRGESRKEVQSIDKTFSK